MVREIFFKSTICEYLDTFGHRSQKRLSSLSGDCFHKNSTLKNISICMVFVSTKGILLIFSSVELRLERASL